MNSTHFLIGLAFVASFTLQPMANAKWFSFRLPKKLPVQSPRSAPHVEVPPVRPNVSDAPVPKPHPEESFLSEAAKAAIEPAISWAIDQAKNSNVRKEKRLHLEEAFRQLERWHRDLTARCLTLDLNDQQAIRVFNLEVARYHAALAFVRDALSAIPPRI